MIRANILQEVHKSFVVYQLLKALKYMHSADVLHRDIKVMILALRAYSPYMQPSNLLIDSDCVVKLADFGLARSVKETGAGRTNAMTDYVNTMWYSAPEILLGSTRYTKGVDMWSVGCILGELLTGKAVFTGTHPASQAFG